MLTISSYNVFLPIYLRTRGAELGGLSPGKQWQYYAAANLSSIPSPVLAGFMCRSRWFWGRRGTMIIGATITMAFFFAYTQVRNNAQNTGFTCAISFSLVSLLCLSNFLLSQIARITHSGIQQSLHAIFAQQSKSKCQSLGDLMPCLGGEPQPTARCSQRRSGPTTWMFPDSQRRHAFVWVASLQPRR